MRPNLGRITRPDDKAGNMSLTYHQNSGKLYGLFEKLFQVFFCTPYAFRNFGLAPPSAAAISTSVWPSK